MSQKDLAKQEFAAAASVFFRGLAEMVWDQFHSVTVMPGESPARIPQGVNRKKAAELLDVSPSTIDAMVKAKQLHPTQVKGRAKRYPLDQIESILKKRE